MALLDGFTAIKNITGEGETVSVIGVLIDCKEPFKTRGTDWALEFTIQDDFTGASHAVGGQSSMKCRVFRPKQSRLPSSQEIGDLVIVRDIKVTKYNNKVEAISSSLHRAALLFFPAAKIPDPGFSVGFGVGGEQKLSFSGTWDAKEPSAAEQLAIIKLNGESKSFGKAITQPTTKVWTAPPKRDRRALIQDMVVGNYYDIVVEVVKIYSAGFDSLDLYVTDYTVNRDLFLYDDPGVAEAIGFKSSSQWQGPPGQVTMQVRLWDPHASYAHENIHVGDNVIITDVHAKLSQANKLEGGLHQDQKYHDKIKIRKVTWPGQIAELQKRKEDYLYKYDLQRDQQHIGQKDENLAKKPSAKASARKKEEKKQQQRQKKAQEQLELERKVKEQEVARAGINRHVVAAHPTVDLSTVDEILNNPARTITNVKDGNIDLPFVNAKHRTRVRVVDFTPPNLEDFTRSMQDPDWNRKLRDATIKDHRRDDRWQWAFVLCVEDASVPEGTAPLRFPLVVNDDAAQYLLHMNAIDLRNDRQGHVLKKLEEKLFILWGNLLELKKDLAPKGTTFPLPSGDNRLQNLPFECCVEEYGSKLPEPTHRWPKGYQRMHRLMGTVIRSEV